MLLPQGVNSAVSNKNLDIKLKVLKAKANDTALLIQNGRLRDYAKSSKKFCKHLESCDDRVFGSVGIRFNKSTIDREGDLVSIKTLCDLREEDMIAFALKAWRMPGELSSGKTFQGIFSFSNAGSAYKSEQESPTTKPNENYLLKTDGQEVEHARLMKRNKVVGTTFEPVTWE